MRSTQVAAAWVPCLLQGPDSHSPARLKFLKLLISSTGSGSPLSPAALSPNAGVHLAATSPTKSTESDDSGSGETDSGSAFSSPEAVRPVPRLPLGKASALPSTTSNAALIVPPQVSSGNNDGVQDLLKECRGVMQVLPLVSVTHNPSCKRHTSLLVLTPLHAGLSQIKPGSSPQNVRNANRATRITSQCVRYRRSKARTR